MSRQWEKTQDGWQVRETGAAGGGGPSAAPAWVDGRGNVGFGSSASTYPCFRLELGGELRTSADFELVKSELGPGGPGASTSGTAPGSALSSTLGLTFRRDGLEVHVSLTCYDEHPVVTVSATLRNVGDIALEIKDPCVGGGLPSAGLKRVRWVEGVHLEEQQQFPLSFTHRHFDWTRAGRAGRVYEVKGTGPWGVRPSSSNTKLPWIVLDGAGFGEGAEENSSGFFTGIIWSGPWAFRLFPLEDRVGAYGGSLPVRTRLEPGRTFNVPPVFVGAYRGRHSEASALTHEFVRKQIMRPLPDDAFPWVQFNSWYPWEKRLDEKTMLAQLGVAAELGAEVFVLDDGWFVGAGTDNRWGTGAGNWVEDLEKFPSGLKAFGDRVRQTGMRYGLWVEPERVDPGILEIAKSINPHWFAENPEQFEKDPRGRRWEQVCLGCPEAVEWLKQNMRRIVESYRPDWIKWDHNWFVICTRTDHGHGAGDGAHRHIEGLYEVLGDLKSRYPDLVIENCSSGGARLDFGILRFTHTTWLSDLPAPSHRARSQFAGAVSAYPPEHLNAWVIPHKAEPVTVESARYLVRSRMMGAFGISYTIDNWSDELRSIVRDEVARYKELRPLIKAGRVELPLGRETDVDQWFAVHISTPGRGALLVFRNESPDSCRYVPLHNLDPRKEYTFHNVDTGENSRHTGAELAADGLKVRLSEQKSSAFYWIEAV